MRPESFPELVRRGFYESCEDRLALTADPIADLFEEDLLGEEITQHREIAPTLAEAHESSGLNYVRESYGFRGDGQTVAVIDSGIAYDHEALGEGFGEGYRVVGGWDFSEENDANPYDDGPAGFHGTHVAGIIGSDDARHMGVAPDVDLVGLRVFNDQGQGYMSWVEDALQWVHEHRNDFENPITTVNLSLGTSWNDDIVPDGSILEDEFAQLESDGIFIAVSAGNSFQKFNQEAGLSYPAASPHVVPVASVDSDGNLSDFSQRTGRVLAAPGEYITSSVPDFIFGADGVHNDFGTASGTSMAAPYVAGASVLLREAMQFVGYSEITQDTLYDHLFETADVVHDSITGLDIHRINLQNAFDTLMLTDEDASGPALLGTLDSGLTQEGLINRADDVDTYTFTAAQTGQASFTLTSAEANAVQWQNSAGQAVEGNHLQFQVTAGQSYTVALAGNGSLARYSFDAAIESAAVDLGAIDFDSFNDQAISGETLYHMTATSNGYLSVMAAWNPGDGNLQLQLFNEQNQLLATGDSTSGSSQIDAIVSAGESVYLRVAGNAEVDLTAANLVGLSGEQVTVEGTAGNDSVTLSAGNTHRLSVNGFQYTFAASQVRQIQVAGSSGADSIVINGTAANDNVTINRNSLAFSGSGFRLSASDFETVVINGGGGNDLATLSDTAGNDTFEATSTMAMLSGEGYSHRVNEFSRVNAFASGGTDLAVLYDSAGDDVYGGLHDHSFLYGEGFYNYARGFDRVNAFSIEGGNDLARLYDSAGDDVYGGLHDYSFLYGKGFYNYARGFDRVNAFAVNGGNDLALLYDSAGNDVYQGYHDHSFMHGEGFYNYARGFDRVNAYAHNGGKDLASFHGSQQVDTFVGTALYNSQYGKGYYNYATGFEETRVHADSEGRGYFFDLGAEDSLRGQRDYLTRDREGLSLRYEGFGEVYLYSNGELNDDISAVDYYYQHHLQY